MARPTNKARILRMLHTFGAACEEPGGFEYRALPLREVREALGPGGDSAILDLLMEDGVEHHTFLADVHEGSVSVPGSSHDTTGRDDIHLCTQTTSGE